ncbi:MAG: ABC transporter ATP-binding protein [Parvibaculaceae bacterium]
MTEAPVLEVRNLERRFGGIKAVDGLSFAVAKGSIHGLIGPNGAGKTTTFNVVTGFYPPTGGQVLYRGEDVSRLRTSALAARGLVRTFQGTTLFKEMSVRDNVRIGCHGDAKAGFLARIFGRDRETESKVADKADSLLKFFGLSSYANEPAASLAHGHARALGMAVAFAADPELILMDEPFTGMNPEETRRMMGLVRDVRARGVTVVLVEHDMQAVMGLCDRITVMNFGKLLAEGSPEEVRGDPRVVEAYLGRADDAA